MNLGLLYIYYTPAAKTLQGDEYYYVDVATLIVRGYPGEQSLLWPPFYGELMGRVFALFGLHRLSMQAVQIALWLAAGIAIHRTALQLAADPAAANMTAAFFLLSPELMAFTHFLWAEMVHLFFFVTALWLVVCHARSVLAVAISGVLLGLALLTKLLLLPIAPLIPVAFAVCTTMPWRAKFGRALLLGTMIVLTIAPTILGNRTRRGELMIADSSALALWLGLNPGASHPGTVREFMNSGPDMHTRNAIYREKAFHQIREQGILATVKRQASRQYFQLFSYETWFTLQLPGRLNVMKGRYQFQSPGLALFLHLYAHVVHAVLLAAMALGVAALRPRSARWWNVLLSFLLYNVALYLIVNTNARYFIQMMPVVMLFAGVGACGLVRLARREAVTASCFSFTRTRLVLGIGLVALVEFLAFRDLPRLGI